MGGGGTVSKMVDTLGEGGFPIKGLLLTSSAPRSRR